MGGESMWKLVFIALIVFVVWKFYPQLNGANIQKAESVVETGIKKEKTINVVTETRDKLNKEAQAAMDKY